MPNTIEGLIAASSDRAMVAMDMIDAVEARAQEWAEAITLEQMLEDDRPAKKRDAIQRLMQLENPLTSKPHSASSAETVVETDDEYRAYRLSQGTAVIGKIEAQGAYDAAKLRAKLAVGLVVGDGA